MKAKKRIKTKQSPGVLSTQAKNVTQFIEPLNMKSMAQMKISGESDNDGFDSPNMAGMSPAREWAGIMLYDTLPSRATKVFSSNTSAHMDAKRNRIDYLLQEGNNSNGNLKQVL